MKKIRQIETKVINKIFCYFQKRYWLYQYELYRLKYDLHSTFKFNGYDILFYGDGSISIGENTYIGRNSSLQASTGTKITIGKNCAISYNVKIYTSKTFFNYLCKC
ncbi:MAG: hypothetical protein CVU41_18220 [Chloroflexi bacterium HGW-Chloroflexi-3]|nr:MAG: hypothetical protein CVU41_18220 [Chloroflexi bacterium HGW-Chloroflexi-3]